MSQNTSQFALRGIFDIINPALIFGVSAIVWAIDFQQWISDQNALNVLNSYPSNDTQTIASIIESTYHMQSYFLYSILASVIIVLIFLGTEIGLYYKKSMAWDKAFFLILVAMGWFVAFFGSLSVMSPSAHFNVGVNGTPPEIAQNLTAILEFQSYIKYSAIAVEFFTLLVSLWVSASFLYRYWNSYSCLCAIPIPVATWAVLTYIFPVPNTNITIDGVSGSVGPPGTIVWFNSIPPYPFSPQAFFVEATIVIGIVVALLWIYSVYQNIEKLYRWKFTKGIARYRKNVRQR